MLRCCVIIAFVMAFLSGNGQGFISPAELPEAFRSSPKLMAGFDSKRSFIANRDVKIFGVRAGLDFDHKAGVGFGFYTLRSPFVRNFVLQSDFGSMDTVRSNLQFSYMSLWFEYTFLATRRWELSVPLSFGFGEAHFRGFKRETYTPVFLVEASLEGQYKILSWLGLGAGIGYRQPYVGNPGVRENFGALIYRFGVRFFLGPIVNKILGKPTDF